MMWPFRKKTKPAPEPLDLTPYQGQWVAVRDNKLIAAAPTAYVLLEMIKAGGLSNCTIWFEERPEDVLRWSVQYPSEPGKVYPNCKFATREAAEAWISAWRGTQQERGEVFTRDGQHEPWYPAPEKAVTTDA